MLIGYARVSSSEQDNELQLAALRRKGVRKIFEEKRSGGSTTRRLELARMLEQLRAGDVVHVYKLDRLARSLRDLLQILETIEQRGAAFRSLTESIDTTTPAGRMMMQMLGAFAEFERNLIRERSMAGMEVAKANGVRLGRLPALDKRQSARLAKMWDSQEYTKAELARHFDVSLSTIKRTLWRLGLDTISEAHAHGMLPPTP
jgi:DNA invertase Pin-like site-specific DNA recombinase